MKIKCVIAIYMYIYIYIYSSVCTQVFTDKIYTSFAGIPPAPEQPLSHKRRAFWLAASRKRLCKCTDRSLGPLVGKLTHTFQWINSVVRRTSQILSGRSDLNVLCVGLMMGEERGILLSSPCPPFFFSQTLPPFRNGISISLDSSRH